MCIISLPWDEYDAKYCGIKSINLELSNFPDDTWKAEEAKSVIITLSAMECSRHFVQVPPKEAKCAKCLDCS